MNKPAKAFGIKTATAGTLKFSTLDDVERFVATQRAYYTKLLDGPLQGQVHQSLRNTLNNQFATLQNQVNTLRTSDAVEFPSHVLEELFNSKQLPIAESTAGRFLAKIKASEGNAPTSWALTSLAPKFASGAGININDAVGPFRGCYLAFNFVDDVGSVRKEASKEVTRPRMIKTGL